MMRAAGHGLLLLTTVVLVPLWYAVAVLSGSPALLTTYAPIYGLLTALYLAIAVWVGNFDAPAALLGGYLILRGALCAEAFAFEVTTAIAAGLALYGLFATMDPVWRQRVRWAVLGVGILQIAFAGLHTASAAGFTRIQWSTGTLGNTNYLGAYLAISAAMVPVGWLPLWALGIILSKSVLASLAFAMVLCCRIVRRPVWTLAGGLLTSVLVLWARGTYLSSWSDRLTSWLMGLSLWSESLGSMLFGLGPGAWLRMIPARQSRMGWANDRVFLSAHNEPLQLLMEAGAIALVLLLVWVTVHRRAWMTPTGCAILCAVAVESLGMFPFQVASTAALSLAALAFAAHEGDDHGRRPYHREHHGRE